MNNSIFGMCLIEILNSSYALETLLFFIASYISSSI